MTVVEAALQYVNEMGWSVIPISSKSKKPLIKWKEYSRRLPTEREIASWWTEFPTANVAVITGRVSGLVVVDIDPDKGGDANAWIQKWPTARSVVTRRGGRHYYYRTPSSGETVRNSVGRLGAGIDVRGESGYVLAPPSVGYSWNGGGRPSVHEELPEPRFDVEHRKDSERERGAVSTEHWIERTLQGVGSGERNNAAAKLAGYFLGKGAPPDIVIAQLLAWNRANRPPLPDGDIRIVVESVDRTRRDKPRRGFILTDTDESGGGVGDTGEYSVIDFGAYIAKYGHQQVSWLVDKWLPRETVGMVVAPPGSYKTWLLQDLAISVATGLPFLGQFPVANPGPVLFMQQEDWHGQIAHRFALIASHRAGLNAPTMESGVLRLTAPPKIPVYLHEHRRFRFDDKEIVESWVAQIRRLRPALVVLDPLYSAGSVDDFMAGTAAAMFLFKSIRDSLGTTFLIAHHTRKQKKEGTSKQRAEEGPDREDVWGSQFLNAWIETGWQIRRREELGSATILRHFKVQSETAKAVISFNIDTTQLPTKYDVAVREASDTGGGGESDVDLVRILEIAGNLSVAGMVKATGLPRTTIHRKVSNLIKAGILIQSGNGYTLTENHDAEER